MQLQKRSIRNVLKNNRGYSLVDLLVGLIAMGMLGFVAIGAVYASMSGTLGIFLAVMAGLVGIGGIGAYSYTLWKKGASRTTAEAKPVTYRSR